MQYREKWLRSSSNEFGRLTQGIRDATGTDTITFIAKTDVPMGRSVTYAQFVATLHPQKAEQERTRLTVGGNLIDYPGDVSTRTAGLTTAKLLWNSVLSKRHRRRHGPKAKYMCLDVKNFYLNTPMDRPEYMRIPINLIPQDIIDAYGLEALAHEGHVYIRINKGMYGLPQACKLANDLLAKRLATHGYYQSPFTQGLWCTGNTLGAQSNSPSSSTTSASNTKARNTPSTSSAPSPKTMNTLLTGQDRYAVVSHSNGIMKTTQCARQCRATSKRPYTNSVMFHPSYHNTPPTKSLPNNMESRSNKQLPQTPLHS
jgi:hypothetical protein